MVSLIVTAGILALLFLRVPVALALIIPAVVYVEFSSVLSMGVVVQRLVGSLDSFPLLAIPLFIMVGYAANESGLAKALFDWAEAILARVRGRLGYINISTSVVFSWMSGTATADAAGLGSVLLPRMAKSGYPMPFSIGLTGSSAAIGPLMPPSVTSIVYAVTAGVSIGGMFAAGVLPAFLLALVLTIFTWFKVRTMVLDEPTVDRTPLDLVRITVKSLPVLFTPVIVIGGILGGVFTPTEAAAVAVAYVLLLGVVKRAVGFASIFRIMRRTAWTAGQVLLIVAGGQLFAFVLAQEGSAQDLARFVEGSVSSAIVFLLILNVFLLVLGMVLEPAAAIVIAVPIILPLATVFEIDPLHLGMITVLNLTLGLLTPPTGIVLFILAAVGRVPVSVAIRGAGQFWLPLAVVLLLVTYVPALSLTIPGLAGR